MWKRTQQVKKDLEWLKADQGLVQAATICPLC